MISSLYYVNKFDPVFKEALAVGVSREEEWARKSSKLCECGDILKKFGKSQ